MRISPCDTAITAPSRSTTTRSKRPSRSRSPALRATPFTAFFAPGVNTPARSLIASINCPSRSSIAASGSPSPSQSTHTNPLNPSTLPKSSRATNEPSPLFCNTRGGPVERPNTKSTSPSISTSAPHTPAISSPSNPMESVTSSIPPSPLRRNNRKPSAPTSARSNAKSLFQSTASIPPISDTSGKSSAIPSAPHT